MRIIRWNKRTKDAEAYWEIDGKPVVVGEPIYELEGAGPENGVWTVVAVDTWERP